MGMSKRSVAGVALVACLAVPASAAAKSATYTGSLGGIPSSSVAVVATLKHGDPVKVTRVDWSGLTLECSNGGTAPGSGQIQVSGKSWKVKPNGKFHIRLNRKDATGHVFAKYDVGGDFSANAKKVTGGIVHRQDGFGGPANQCEGSASYRAAK
jgi:hypothetical protein